MFVEVKHVYNCNLYNLILHKYSHHIDNIYIVVLNIYANIVFILTNPAKVAKLYIQLAVMDNPPVNMPMGSDSVDGIRQICANTVKAMDEIRPLAATTDY